jgi:hypothetical protein
MMTNKTEQNKLKQNRIEIKLMNPNVITKQSEQIQNQTDEDRQNVKTESKIKTEQNVKHSEPNIEPLRDGCNDQYRHHAPPIYQILN